MVPLREFTWVFDPHRKDVNFRVEMSGRKKGNVRMCGGFSAYQNDTASETRLSG